MTMTIAVQPTIAEAIGEYEAEMRKALASSRCLLARYDSRDQLRRKYSYAIPTCEAIDAIARHSPIIEIGAGSGYWAYLLKLVGADVLALDNYSWCPPGASPDCVWGKIWTRVDRGGVHEIPLHPHRTLFLCWPPYAEPLAADCLKVYTGSKFLFVGESVGGYAGGCTGDDEFHKMLYEQWDLVERVDLPQWPGINDDLQIYERI